MLVTKMEPNTIGGDFTTNQSRYARTAEGNSYLDLISKESRHRPEKNH